MYGTLVASIVGSEMSADQSDVRFQHQLLPMTVLLFLSTMASPLATITSPRLMLPLSGPVLALTVASLAP